MALKTTPQNYYRIEDQEDKFYGFLDDSKLHPHSFRIPDKNLQSIILQSIIDANKKSSRAILEIPDNADDNTLNEIFIKEGKALFKYFVKYCGDPASTAHECLGRHYAKIGIEQFRNRTLQKQRMNSGWRYQYIAKSTALVSKRFISVSDIGASEADFNASIKQNHSPLPLHIYVSVKNRTNTMGGQDWPKAIRALEDMAKNDKNKTGPYVCVFGIAMEKGQRGIKTEQKTGLAYSVNTEVWLSDFFWPFFSNYSYDKIIKSVLDVINAVGESSMPDVEIPDKLLESFGICCQEYNLLDEKGNFVDAYKLVELFCGKLK